MPRRPNKVLDAVSWMLEPLSLNDDEIGKWLACRFETWWDQGGMVNHLWRKQARIALSTKYLEQAATAKKDAQIPLAFALALDGRFNIAGKAWRTAVSPFWESRISTEKSKYANKATKLKQQIENESRWFPLALAYRKRDPYAPDSTIAERVSKKSKNTIRKRLRAWEIDKRTWLSRDRVKRSVGKKPKKPRA